MSNKITTTESVTNPADVSEVINPGIPTEIKPTDDVKVDKCYDPSHIDSVLDVVNNADPISRDVPVDVEYDCAVDSDDKKCKTVVGSAFKPSKRDKRKKKAKVMLGAVCGIAVYCINIVFALLMINFISPAMSDIMTNIITITFASIITLDGIALYNYIAKAID